MTRAVAFFAVAAAVVVVAASARTEPQQAPAAAYPEGYRSWTHVKSAVILPGHPLEASFGGIHHVYANRSAVIGLKSGHYADGSVLVFDLLAADAKDNAVGEGGRKFVAVMQRDARGYASTGGWGYEAFAGDSKTERVVKDGGTSCQACHQSRAQQGFVFSEWRP
jgi:hypothetical protein